MARNKRTRQGTIDDAVLGDGEEWEVEAVLARACGKQGERYLVRWKGYAQKHDTWEPAANLVGAAAIVDKFNKDRDAAAIVEKKEAEEKRQAALAAKRKREEVTLPALAMPRNKRIGADFICRSSMLSWRRQSVKPSLRTVARGQGATQALGGSTSRGRATRRRATVLSLCSFAGC